MNLDHEERQEENMLTVPDRPAAPAANHMALASMILGIVSFFGICCCGVGGIAAGSLAVIFGLLSKVEDRIESKALAGIIMGAAAIILGAAAMILLFLANVPVIQAELGGY